VAKGYLEAHIRVQDRAKFAGFRALAGPAITEFGGRVLVRNPVAGFRGIDVRGIPDRFAKV
jgi:uncharacterized protein (DUF1330 family)